MELQQIPADWECIVSYNPVSEYYPVSKQIERYISGEEEIRVVTFLSDGVFKSVFFYIYRGYAISGESRNNLELNKMQMYFIDEIPFLSLINQDTPRQIRGKVYATVRERGVMIYPMWRNKEYFHRICKLLLFDDKVCLEKDGTWISQFDFDGNDLAKAPIFFDFNTLLFSYLPINGEKVCDFIKNLLIKRNKDVANVSDEQIILVIKTMFPKMNELYQAVNTLPLPISEEVLPHLLVV